MLVLLVLVVVVLLPRRCFCCYYYFGVFSWMISWMDGPFVVVAGQVCGPLRVVLTIVARCGRILLMAPSRVSITRSDVFGRDCIAIFSDLATRGAHHLSCRVMPERPRRQRRQSHHRRISSATTPTGTVPWRPVYRYNICLRIELTSPFGCIGVPSD